MLPIEPEGDHYRLFDANEAHRRGFLSLERWLGKAEKEWNTRRGSKASRMKVYERLDRFHGLTTQNPQAKYRVVYNTSGTHLTAAVVEDEPIEFEVNGQYLTVQGFLVDYTTYYYELTYSHEAFYLAAVLNAPVIDRLIKPMQSRGLWGPRHICKKVLELPIHQFHTANPVHCKLAELGEEYSTKVQQWLASGGKGKIKSIGKLRGIVREMLKDELEEIDRMVKEILV